MDTPPPIPPQILPATIPLRFKLPRSAWIAWGVYAVFCVTLFLIRQIPVDPRSLGELTGNIVGILLLPVVLAMLVWRLGGRSSSAANATFFVIFGLAAAGQIAQFSQRAQAQGALNQWKNEQLAALEEQRIAREQGRAPDSVKVEKVAAQAAAKLGVLAENSTGNDRVVAEAGKAYLDGMLAAKKRYDDAVKELDVPNFWALARFSPGQPADARRAAIRKFSQSNRELARFQDENATELQRIMKARGVSSSEIGAAVTGFKKTGGARLPLMVKIRETDEQLAQTMLEFIDFAESNHARWHVEANDGKVIFEDQALLNAYNDLIKRVNTISAEQADDQKQVVAIKPAQ